MKNRSAFAALSVYFLDNFALAIVYPIFTPLLYGKDTIFLSGISHRRLLYLGLLIAAFPLAQFFGAPIVGSFADRKGRKKAFFLTLVAEVAGFSLSAYAISQANYALLFFSRLWTGFFAGNLTVCLAVFADLYGMQKKRSKAFGLLMMAGGTSFIFAILTGGLLSNAQINPHFNPSNPFWFTACLTLINLIIVTFIFKETGPQSKRHPFYNLYKIATTPEYRPTRQLYILYFFLMLAWMPTLQFLSPFLLLDYQATPLIITGVFTILGVVWALSASLGNHILINRFTPRQILFYALPVFSLCLLGTVFPYRLITFVPLICLAAGASALAWTNALSLISIGGDPTLQGKILGLNQSVGALAMVIAPLISSYIGMHNLHIIFLCNAIYLAIAFAIFYKQKRSAPNKS